MGGGDFVLIPLSINCFGQVVLSSPINLKNKKMVVVKSKLKFSAYKPEVQQTDMTSVNETCQESSGVCAYLPLP